MVSATKCPEPEEPLGGGFWGGGGGQSPVKPNAGPKAWRRFKAGDVPALLGAESSRKRVTMLSLQVVV